MVVGIFFGGIIFINFLCKMVEGKSDIIDEIFGVVIIFILWDLFKIFNFLE